jgi:hypothetical protein
MHRFLENRLAVIGLVVIVILYALVLAEPLITTFPYDQLNPGMRDKLPSGDH